MKGYLKLIFLCFALSFLTYQNGQGQGRSVLDYFMDLPSSWYGLGFENIADSDKKAMVDETDIGNGWLRFSGKGEYTWEGWGEFVIFKKPDKSYMIAIAVAECGPACVQHIRFLDFDNGRWIDITDKVFTPLSAAELSSRYRSKAGADEFTDEPPVLYVLPRYGTSLRVITQSSITGKPETELATYKYSNGVFVKN